MHTQRTHTSSTHKMRRGSTQKMRRNSNEAIVACAQISCTPPQQHLLPWAALLSTLGPTLMLGPGASMGLFDCSSDLLDTMR